MTKTCTTKPVHHARFEGRAQPSTASNLLRGAWLTATTRQEPGYYKYTLLPPHTHTPHTCRLLGGVELMQAIGLRLEENGTVLALRKEQDETGRTGGKWDRVPESVLRRLDASAKVKRVSFFPRLNSPQR